jgi:hypothetical protein
LKGKNNENEVLIAMKGKVDKKGRVRSSPKLKKYRHLPAHTVLRGFEPYLITDSLFFSIISSILFKSLFLNSTNSLSEISFFSLTADESFGFSLNFISLKRKFAKLRYLS